MEQEVTWVMHLKDMFTGGIHNADKATQHLEGTMHQAGQASMSLGKQLVSVATAALSMYEGIDFVKSSVHDFHALEEANAQLKAGLESTGYAAGVTFDDLEKGSISFAEHVKYSRAEISDMQAQLLTFPGVTKSVFNDASQSILDMSTRLHRGLNETAIMVGKALQDPARGITALRRVGVNFNDEQTKIIKNLVATGHAGEAQTRILKELQTEFAGSARAAADSDPLFRYHKIMEDIRLSVGSLAMELIKMLAPAITAVAKAFQGTIQWMKEHKDLTIAIASTVGLVVGGLIIYETVMKASAIATKLMTVAQWALNIAQMASPLTWIVLGLIAATAAVIYCYRHFEAFRAVLLGVWATIKEFGHIVTDVFLGLGKVIAGVLTFNPALVVEGAKQTINAIADAGTRMGQAFHQGYNDGIADFAKDHASSSDAVAPKAIIKALPGKVGAPGENGKSETAKATGTKNTTIHITIGSLINKLENHFATMKEGATNIKEQVVSVLLSAVNDAQIVSGE